MAWFIKEGKRENLRAFQALASLFDNVASRRVHEEPASLCKEDPGRQRKPDGGQVASSSIVPLGGRDSPGLQGHPREGKCTDP